MSVQVIELEEHLLDSGVGGGLGFGGVETGEVPDVPGAEGEDEDGFGDFFGRRWECDEGFDLGFEVGEHVVSGFRFGFILSGALDCEEMNLVGG
jgi:hypothetical protein